MLKPGFIPALGTPLNADGSLAVESFKKHINDQIEAGAVALLCMGSMGQEAFIRESVYPEVAKAAVEANNGRVPLFVGAMDTSIARVKDKIAPLEDLDIDGFVFTAPFYSVATPVQIMNFYKGIAKCTKHKILAYDLPPVAHAKITYEMVLELIETVPNFGGIKTADTQMLRKLKLNPNIPKDFVMAYSGLDTFDVAYKWGITNCLDGMLCCTLKNTSKMFKAMENDDYTTAAECLSNIVSLRDVFAANVLWPCFTYAMNELGYEGSFMPDYNPEITEQAKINTIAEMKRIGEL